MKVRRVVGVARLLAGVGLLTVIVIQISDRVVNNAFDPSEYFSYFTIETSLINIVVFLVGAFGIVTAAVYNLILRNVPYSGDFAGLQWPNEIIHVWVPIYIVLDWLFSPGRPALLWRSLPVMVGLTGFIVAIGALAIAYTRWRAPTRSTPGSMAAAASSSP